MENDTGSELVIIWTSADPDVFNKLVYMYAYNSLSKGWWSSVRLVIWGPSVRMAAGDEEIMIRLTGLREAGVRIESCRVCSDDFGVTEVLERLGIDVKYMGEPLTQYLKGDHKVITY